jgi:hypothetical protein
VRHIFIPPGQNVAGNLQVLQRLGYVVRRERRYKRQGQRFLHHDNAPSHTSPVMQQFLADADTNIPVIIQPPHSPDLAPGDFSDVSYHENGPQCVTFYNKRVYQMEWDGRPPEDVKSRLYPVFPTMVGLLEQASARA